MVRGLEDSPTVQQRRAPFSFPDPLLAPPARDHVSDALIKQKPNYIKLESLSSPTESPSFDSLPVRVPHSDNFPEFGAFGYGFFDAWVSGIPFPKTISSTFMYMSMTSITQEFCTTKFVRSSVTGRYQMMPMKL